MHVCTSSNASGAAQFAKQGLVTVIVDVIDMSTSLETALEMGAVAVFGASPTDHSAPVDLYPQKIGQAAGKLAKSLQTGVLIIGEPRVGSEKEREKLASCVIAGIKGAEAEVLEIIPNLGASIARLTDMESKVVVAVTASGGTAFDAAWNSSDKKLVTTATVARTAKNKSFQCALNGVKRAIKLAQAYNTGIGLVAASGNALEDILAVEYLYKKLLEQKF